MTRNEYIKQSLRDIASKDPSSTTWRGWAQGHIQRFGKAYDVVEALNIGLESSTVTKPVFNWREFGLVELISPEQFDHMFMDVVSSEVMGVRSIEDLRFMVKHNKGMPAAFIIPWSEAIRLTNNPDPAEDCSVDLCITADLYWVNSSLVTKAVPICLLQHYKKLGNE